MVPPGKKSRLSDSDLLVDGEKTYIKGPLVWAMIGIVVCGATTLCVYLIDQANYRADTKQALQLLQTTLVSQRESQDRDRIATERKDEELLSAIRSLKDDTTSKLSEIKTELVRMNLDTVPGRDATTWIEKFRLAWRAWQSEMQVKNPSMVWTQIDIPDMPPPR